ncbi:MAG TPA: agmatine deiminase [Steroidobacteraceae bacterium]|jgi:agmatine deiminase|nr:agmatine deiminase [Steroidobacteraceae bacterium]
MSQTLKKTPAADGFWMPGEFEPHAGTWMLWPERPDNWRERAVPAQRAFAAVATAIARFEPVTVGVSAAHFDGARAQLPPHIRVVEMSHDDAWARDVAPTFVVNEAGAVRGVDWRFNAWGGDHGGLYSSWDQDERVARKVLEIERCDRYAAHLVNEGGAVHVDGVGTVLVTEECLLNRNRNPNLSRKQIEKALRDYLGVSTIIWLGKGVFNDETDGHIDELAAFVRPGEVVLTWTDDRRDPQYAISQDAWQRLNDARDARGRRLKVHKLPMPGPLYMTAKEAKGVVTRPGTKPRPAGERLAASYVNFYATNGGIVMPLLDPRTDRAAAAQLRRLFPKRRIVGVPTREVLLGGGNIHCITQQVPAAGRARRKPEAVR